MDKRIALRSEHAVKRLSHPFQIALTHRTSVRLACGCFHQRNVPLFVLISIGCAPCFQHFTCDETNCTSKQRPRLQSIRYNIQLLNHTHESAVSAESYTTILLLSAQPLLTGRFLIHLSINLTRKREIECLLAYPSTIHCVGTTHPEGLGGSVNSFFFFLNTLYYYFATGEGGLLCNRGERMSKGTKTEYIFRVKGTV